METDREFLQQVYFGFSHCPDICPDELDKMALMYDKVVEKCGPVLLPIMITCDPARDTPAVLKEYLKEFHPDIIGLTGDYDAIKDTCKAYRVYFSTPPSVKPGQDYLVDHSIYFYLMGKSAIGNVAPSCGESC
jgi:protein SCO1/2